MTKCAVSQEQVPRAKKHLQHFKCVFYISSAQELQEIFRNQLQYCPLGISKSKAWEPDPGANPQVQMRSKSGQLGPVSKRKELSTMGSAGFNPFPTEQRNRQCVQ